MSDPPPQTPSKPPPSWWWLLGPVALVLLSGVAFVGLLAWTIQDLAHVDARVPADGKQHRVVVATDGDRMLMADASAARRPCSVTNAAGRDIEQHDVLGELTVTTGGQEWSGLTSFAPGDGRITVTCPRARGQVDHVLITSAVSPGGFFLRVGVLVVVPLVLGGIGLLWGLLLAVVILTRRSEPAR